jgi:hypothetical protein
LPTYRCASIWSGPGFLARPVNASTRWVRASAPVAAVRPGGQVSVSSGSTIAITGSRYGEATPTFMPRSASYTTETQVTSAPVPPVVGTVSAPRRVRLVRLPLASKS